MRTPHHLRTQSASINSMARHQTTGAKTFTARTGLSAVECTVQPDNSSESMAYMRETGKRRSKIALPVTWGGVAVVVKSDDVIVVTTDGTAVTYKVDGPGMNAAGQGANYIVPVYEEA